MQRELVSPVIFPRTFRINPAFFNMPVATFTVALRTPSICERNSCVSGKVSAPARSCVINSQRAQRSSMLCIRLQAAP